MKTIHITPLAFLSAERKNGRPASRANPAYRVRSDSYSAIAVLLMYAALMLMSGSADASQREVIQFAKTYIERGEYYSAITETMRYQHLYPEGLYYPESLLLMAEAYFKGGNTHEAAASMTRCYDKYKNRPEGEKALYLLGHIRLLTGSTYYAYRTYQEYNYLYRNGAYSEDAAADSCYALVLLKDIEGAKDSIGNYMKLYPGGKYTDNLKALQDIIDNESTRPRKSVWLSVIGSIFIPGFGHFYAEKYSTGLFSLGINAALIYLLYDGARARNSFRIIFFSVLEFSFYTYSIFSAVGNAYEYNSSARYYDTIKLGIKKQL